MSRRVLLGEAAGLAWLCADAAWAIGDRWHIENTRLMTGLFLTAISLGIAFIWVSRKGDRS
jgi:hypothetical protein